MATPSTSTASGTTSPDTTVDLPPDIPPTHRVLAGPAFESIDALMTAFNDWARNNGLGFTKTQGSNKSGDQYTRYQIRCDRGGGRPSTANTRSVTTPKTGCAWQAVATALRRIGRGWLIDRIDKPVYNHPPSSTAASHKVHQALTEDMFTVVSAQLLTPTIRTNDIYTALQQRFPDHRHTFSRRQVQNLRQKLQREKLGVYTPTQALVKSLVEDGNSYYDVLWDDGTSTRTNRHAETLACTAQKRPEAIF